MVQLSPSLTLWVLLPVPVVVLAVYYFGQIIHRLSERIQAALGALSTRAQENLTGVRVVRAYAQEKSEIGLFEKANRDYVDRNIKLIGSWSLFFPALTALIGVSFVILLGKGGTQVMDSGVSLGTLWSFYAFLIQLIFPIIALGWVTNIFQRGAASMGRLNYILTAEPNIRDNADLAEEERWIERKHECCWRWTGRQVKRPFAAKLNSSHLTFAYPTATEQAAEVTRAARHFSCTFLPVLLWPSLARPGSGKSTLAALIARLWEAPAGTLLLDGALRFAIIRSTALRRAIGYVPQDTFLFSETLRENIALRRDRTRWRSTSWKRPKLRVSPARFRAFPTRYDTMVGERGITLSGGQKQRTSLARAILRQPKILVLDDSLSSVDTDTEERILRRLART